VPVNRVFALFGRGSAGPDGIPWRAVLALLTGALALGAAGCVARAAGGATLVYEYPVVEVQTVPVRIEAYPRVVYRGSYAYLVDGRWYYRTEGRWVVFQEEPVELREARVQIVRDHRRRPTTVVPPARPRYYEPPPPYPPPRHHHHD
jgi:hypothetical protein